MRAAAQILISVKDVKVINEEDKYGNKEEKP